jgi:hypothetical protein
VAFPSSLFGSALLTPGRHRDARSSTAPAPDGYKSTDAPMRNRRLHEFVRVLAPPSGVTKRCTDAFTINKQNHWLPTLRTKPRSSELRRKRAAEREHGLLAGGPQSGAFDRSGRRYRGIPRSPTWVGECLLRNHWRRECDWDPTWGKIFCRNSAAPAMAPGQSSRFLRHRGGGDDYAG